MVRMKSLWKVALALVVLTLANPAYPATITVDGDKSDWAGITPLINDMVGELLSYEDLVVPRQNLVHPLHCPIELR